MKITKIVRNHHACAFINSSKKVITNVQSALDLLMTVNYEANTKNIAISKELITDDFFVLRTRLAGEILQKFINYGVRIAIYGDYSEYTSKALQDFIYESNHEKDIFFVDTKEEAIERLTKQ